MADKIVSVVGTVASRLSDLPIKDAQLIFIRDKQKIALDLGGKRTFYNQINVLETEQERVDLLAPISGCFYFVVGTAVLWYYDGNWKAVTTPPENFLFVGIELPELGVENKLYVNKHKRNISVWDDELKTYIPVGNTTDSISNEDIDKLF